MSRQAPMCSQFFMSLAFWPILLFSDYVIASPNITPLDLLDAIDASAAQYSKGDLSFFVRDPLDKSGYQYDKHMYRFVMDGERFFSQTPADLAPTTRIGFDGKTYTWIEDRSAQASLANVVPERFLDATIGDPRYFNNLPQCLSTYIRSHTGQAKVTVPENDDEMQLQIIVPKSEVESALGPWPDACMNGAVVDIWIKMSTVPMLSRMEWRGSSSPYVGKLGSRWTWSSWIEVRSGVQVPTILKRENFFLKDDENTPGFAREYVFTHLKDELSFNDEDFRPQIPQGYKVHDQRHGLDLIYLQGGEFLRPAGVRPEDALENIAITSDQTPDVSVKQHATDNKSLADPALMPANGRLSDSSILLRDKYWIAGIIAVFLGIVTIGSWLVTRGRRRVR